MFHIYLIDFSTELFVIVFRESQNFIVYSYFSVKMLLISFKARNMQLPIMITDINNKK